MKVEIGKLKPLDTLIVKGESYILVHVATYEYYKDKAGKWDELVAGQFKYQVIPMKDHVEVLGTLGAIRTFIKPYYDNYPSKADHYEQEIIEGIWEILETSELGENSEE